MDNQFKAGAAKWRGLGRLVCLMSLLLVSGPGGAGQGTAPIYQVTVTGGTAKAISYRNVSGSTRIGFRGTVLLPGAAGTAKIKNRQGAMAIKAKFEHLEPATRFGPGYLTYVLWSVTPGGRPVNLGEVIVKRNGRAVLEAHTNLQTFGLIVTAEPHFAVARVSNLVVLENTVTKATKGQVEEVEARYELLPREATTVEGNPEDLKPAVLDPRISPYVYQARNAVRIARAERVDQDAPAEFQKAMVLMQQMEAEKKPWKKPAIVLARQVVQQVEDARLIAAKKQEQARLEQEQQAADQARREADAARRETETTRAQAETERLAALLEAQQAKEKASLEAQRAKEEASREASAEQLARRKQLLEQLNRLLDTRESERGLVVSMSDLLFPSGKATLLPATREKLAKITGIMLAYSGLKVSVEGHADSTGADAFNRKLSGNRARAVRAFLAKQGFPADAVTAQGFGSSKPLASNDTVAGRQQNRRVELILSGTGIGF